MTTPHVPMDPRQRPTPPPPALSSPPPAPTPSFAATPPEEPPGFAGQAGGSFAPAPPAPAPFGDATFIGDTSTIQDRVEKKPSIVGRLGLVAAALAVAGGGAFAVSRALTEPVGAQSPEEAVDQMFAAVENEDLVGLTEVMLPSERESLIEPMVDLFDQLERLDVIDERFDLESSTGRDAWDGLDFSVSGLSYTTTVVGDGVVNAEITAGVVTVTGEVADLPFGDRLDEELGEEAMAERLDDQVVDFAQESDVRFTLVEEDGSWYVSLWYSVAEAARAEAGERVPTFGQGVIPVGSDTPESAVRTMLDRAVDLDVEGAIATLDPREFRALHDYAPLFLDEASDATTEARREAAEEGITWSLDRLDLTRVDVRGRTVVQIDGFAFSFTGAGDNFSIDFDGECFIAIEGQEIDEICLDEITNEMDLPEAYAEFAAGYTSGITVVERDGQWFVSGMPTIIGIYADLMAALEPSDIEDLTSFFNDSLDSGFGFDPFGTDPYGDDPFIIEGTPFPDDPFEEDYDPFAEGDVDRFPTLDPAATEVFLPGLELTPAEADFSYFAGVTDYPAAWYAYGYSSETFGSIEIVAFDVPAEQLIAAMDEVDPYVRLDLAGLPEGAVAYEWPEVDRLVVIDNYLVSAYYGFDESQDLLLDQVIHIAGP